MVQAWRAKPLMNPVEQDKLRWFAAACPDVDFQGIPLELAETLYPEISKYGPNGFVVMRIFSDLMVHPGILDSMNRDKANTALDDFEAYIQTLPLLEPGSVFGVRGSLDKEIMKVAEKTHISSLTVESVVYALLFWLAVDGFCEADNTSDDRLEGIRQGYQVFLQRFFDLAGLDSSDYITLSSPRKGAVA